MDQQEDTADLDTTVCCQECGRQLRINFERALEDEWPHCHRRAMAIVATDLDPKQVALRGAS